MTLSLMREEVTDQEKCKSVPLSDHAEQAHVTFMTNPNESSGRK